MNVKLAIIDADSLMYHSSKETLDESIESIEERVDNIFKKTKATHYVMFLSPKKTFRHDIDPKYKINRNKKSANPLKWLKSLRAYLIEKYNAQSGWDVEADDLCAYWMNTPIGYTLDGSDMFERLSLLKSISEINRHDYIQVEKVLCAIDKDLLHSIVGSHFNYTFKSNKDKSVDKGWWVDTKEERIKYFKWLQVLMGDSGDGIKGIPGVGEKTAIRILNNVLSERLITLESYIAHYKNTAKGVYEFQKNFRLLHMLENDEDFLREVGQTPFLPEINEVPKVDINLEF